MSHTFRRGLVLLAAMLMLLGMLATTAYANLDDEPTEVHGVSSSNPGAGVDTWWRRGWGRTLLPDVALYPPDGMDYKVDGYIIGMLYSVDRTPSVCASGAAGEAIIDPLRPDDYYRSSFGGTTDNTGPYGTNADNTIDLLGIFANPPAGVWPVTDPTVEGQWYVHYRYFSSFRYSNTVHTVGFGIDTTPPNPVTGLTLRSGLYSAPVTGWQPSRRMHVSWNPSEYDALSGVGYYEVLIDDKPFLPESTSTATPMQGRVYSAPWLPTPSAITIENMPPGKHKVSVVAVDRATNRSIATTSTYYSDPDTPTVSFTRPTNGLIKDGQYVSADAFDGAGPPRLAFALDGTTIATFTAPPYEFKPDLANVTPGAHVLSATATDMVGRSVTTTIAVSTLATTVVPLYGLVVTDDESLNSTSTATTLTHPNDPMDPEAFWRQGWGNSLHPQFSVEPPSPDAAAFGFIGGMLYSMDRTPNTVIDPARPADYYRTAKGDSTLLDQTVDLFGTYAYPPLGGWPVSTLGGETTPIEGRWYFHYRPFTSDAYTGQSSYSVPIGVDLTKPRSVTGLKASPSLNTSDAGRWTSATRANVTWDAARYDDLSGVAYYQVLIDGVAVVGSSDDPGQGRVYEVSGRTPSSVTIENVPAGAHKISIVAVDRATNESTPTTTMFYSDPAAPKVAFRAPKPGGPISARSTISVDATDDAGDPRVTVSIDSTTLATLVAAPYEFKPNLTNVSAGSHVLSARATDHMGRSVTTTISVTVGSTNVSLDGFIVTDDESLNSTSTATTLTHPNDPMDPEAFWRQGWGNSLHPQFEFATVSASDVNEFGFTTGLLYVVNRTSDTKIDPSTPDRFHKSSIEEGTDFSKTIDLMGVFTESRPVGGWPVSNLGGEAYDYEGIWYFSSLPFTTMGYVPQSTRTIAFGIDVTKPRAVAGLKASPNLDATAANRWTSASRAHVTWIEDRYDALSGVAYYKVLVDGKPHLLDESAEGRIYEVAGKTPSAVTVEDMPAGKHKISIVPVDRATNEGPAASTYFYSDPDAPKIQSIAPTATIIQVKPSLVAFASDLGGVKSVTFKLDGVTVGVDSVPTKNWDGLHPDDEPNMAYSYTPDLSSFSAGAHVLSMTVTDMLGRTSTVKKNVTLDKTPVRVTNFSRSPAIFYPIIREGYKDNSTIKYTLNKSATVTLKIRDSGGRVRKTMTATKNAGSSSFKWNGKWSSDGKVHVGSRGSSTYYYQITAVDSAGYSATTSKISTTIRNYELVKTGTNTVKVVRR